MRLSHVSVPSQFFPCLFQHLFTIPGSTEVTGTKLSSCCLHLDGIPVNLRRRRRPHFQLAVDVDFSERDNRMDITSVNHPQVDTNEVRMYSVLIGVYEFSCELCAVKHSRCWSKHPRL